MTLHFPARWFEAVMYCAYGDESADETKQRVFAIGGVFGAKEQWNIFERVWLERTGGHVFHATECDTDQGEYYSQRTHRENKELYADLTNLIARSGLIGRGVAIDLQAYNGILSTKFNNEDPYYLLFLHVIIHLARQAGYCIPRDRIEFTFDRNQDIEHNASALYDRIIRRREPGEEFEYIVLLNDKVSFATRDTVGIQAADLIAREAMKNLDNSIGPIYRAPRVSAKALWETGRIKFRALDRAWCERVDRESRGHRYAQYDYFDWLEKNKLMNTLANRLKYERSADYKGAIDEE